VTRPFASIILPSRNRPEPLRACVMACLRLDYPADQFEVIVIDDGSSMPIDAWSGDSRVRVIRQDNKGPAAARNAGIASARGAFLAFTDDDCCPRPDWLSTLVDAWSESPMALFGGRTWNGLPFNRFSAASQFLVDYLYDHFARTNPQQRFFTSNNLAGSRDCLMSLGGFDQNFPLPAAEDRDLCDRWREQGGALIYVPAAAVDHYHSLSLEGFLRQQFQYGRGAKTLRARRAMRGAQYPLEAHYFYFGLFAAPFRSMGTSAAARTAALLFAAQVCNVIGFLKQR
jgi:cellulose synthase/poly-beta-1,6-N-acetylglucosamine synthase-like glycosyltransferase